jgi:hypothetical protein
MLFVVNIPPALRPKPDGIEAMFVVSGERVVVAVAVDGPIMVVSANVSPMSAGIRDACLA